MALLTRSQGESSHVNVNVTFNSLIARMHQLDQWFSNFLDAGPIFFRTNQEGHYIKTTIYGVYLDAVNREILILKLCSIH